MPKYDSSSDSDGGEPIIYWNKWFGRREGLVGDIVLWKNKRLSAALVIGASVIWWLFEVAEYHFLTVVFHMLFWLMAILFLWSNMAGLLQIFLMRIYEISCGKKWPEFIGAIACLLILSAVGNYVSTLNLLYFAFLGLMTLPALYERYEHEVEYLARKGRRDAKKLYRKFDSEVLEKLPRGPSKAKKLT